MKILAIETSCDETAAAVIQDDCQILSNIIDSQIDIHAAYGGVVPEIAARSHIEAIQPVIQRALSDAQLSWDDIDAIAVTHQPGLLGSLMIGTLTARTLAVLHHKSLYAIHHLKSHIYANWLKCGHYMANIYPAYSQRIVNNHTLPTFPLIALVVSGGHSQLIRMRNHNDFQIIGTTRDDAVGELFDKVAKILGLPYPGGPAIAQAAQQGDPNKYKLPIPKVPDYDFSFSGLKTAVLRAVQQALNLPISAPSHSLAAQLTPQQAADFAASFQQTAIMALTQKLNKALTDYSDTQSVVLAGGVSANQLLRDTLSQQIQLPLYFPAPEFCTDNAAMVGAAAYFSIQAGQKPADPYTLDIMPRAPIT